MKKAKCPKFRSCNYGLQWDSENCKCERKDWCPVQKECRYGLFWQIDKCECSRQKWCPSYRRCENKLKVWDEKRCGCFPSSKRCPHGMLLKYNRMCVRTPETCKYAPCLPHRFGHWRDGKCRCKLKKDQCFRLLCKVTHTPKYYQGACKCLPITNFRPEKPGFCGPGRRWSIARSECRKFKGCGPGRTWSHRNWGCVGISQCMKGSTWSHETGSCVNMHKICPKTKLKVCP